MNTQNENNVTVKMYDRSQQTDKYITISTSEIAASLTSDQMASLMSRYLNSFTFETKAIEIGKKMCEMHHTIQANFFVWVMYIFKVMGNQKFTDGRNARAVQAMKKIYTMFENGELFKEEQK